MDVAVSTSSGFDSGSIVIDERSSQPLPATVDRQRPVKPPRNSKQHLIFAGVMLYHAVLSSALCLFCLKFRFYIYNPLIDGL